MTTPRRTAPPRPAADPQAALALSGAVDLAAHAEATRLREQVRQAGPANGPGPGPAGGVTVLDVTEATFEQEVLARSMTVPVVLDFWASWCGPCKQLSPVLEKLAEADGGAWVLAKVDVDANPQLSTDFGIQSIPTVLVAVGGRFLQGFSGALPEREVRTFLDQVLAAAQQAGLPGAGGAAPADGAPPLPVEDVDPDLLEADGALRSGDLPTARAAYERVLARMPTDGDAARGLAVVRLAERVGGQTDEQVAAQLAAAPDDPSALGAVADLEVLKGEAEAAFRRLTDAVRRLGGAERDAVRAHLLDLFEVLGADDPAVVAGRRNLASALF